MEEYNSRYFGYAHSNAIMNALKVHANRKGLVISAGYDFIEKNGEKAAFNEMIELAQLSKEDTLFVDSVKEFAGKSLEDFKSALTAINDAGMTVYSLTEPNYDYFTFMSAIEVLEDTTPLYQRKVQYATAVALHKAGIEIKQICTELELSEADVYEAIAEFKRENEKTE